MGRGGGLVGAACVAGLLLAGLAPAVPAAQASPGHVIAQASPGHVIAQASPRGLPGPLPGCPAQRGTAAPAIPPWPQKELGFSSVWNRTR